MAEPDISPLARSLAEQNNVNWRQLAGSGPEGRITERDVFEYLARVAEGDAPVDPTPEPLPEGLQSWPEEDARTAQPAAASYGDDDLLLADDDLLDYESGQGDGAAAPADDEFALDFEASPRDRVERDYIDRDRAERDRAEPPQEAADDEIFLFDEAPRAAPQSSAQGRGFDELDFGASSFESSGTGSGEDELDLLEVSSGKEAYEEVETYRRAEEAEDSLELDFDDEAPAPRGAERSSPAGDGERASSWASAGSSGQGPSSAGPSSPGPSSQESTSSEPSASAPSPSLPARGAERASDRASDRVSDQASEHVTERAEAAPADEATLVSRSEEAPAPSQAALSRLPLMSHGLLLRSQVDLSPLAEARAAVGRGLGKDAEVAPTAFVLRAAAKVMASHPLGEEGRVALAVISRDGLGAAVVDGAADMRFSELLGAVTELAESGRTERDAAGLMVADMSDYAVDEAVFSVGMPVLTLGRILVDSSDGYTYSTLSLSGDLNPVQAADFLGRVAELVASPIELLI